MAQGHLADWIQRFLRDDEGTHANPNLAFADGLLRETRFYAGPVLLPLSHMRTVRVAEDLTDAREQAEFHRKVDAICALMPDWDMPPVLLQYRDGALVLTDGNHRYAALKRMGAAHACAIVWGSAPCASEAYQLIERIAAD